MSTQSSDHDEDLESQQTVLLIAASSNTPRTRWSRIYLILREKNRKLREDRAAQKDSLGLERSTSSSSTSCYSIISTDITGEAVSSVLSLLDFYGASLYAILVTSITMYLLIDIFTGSTKQRK
jgi:hypothetical protein